MKIDIGPYTEWFGPYQLAEKLMFWLNKDDDRVYRFGNFLATGSFEDANKNESVFSMKAEKKTWLYKLLELVESKKKRRVKIHIDKYDVWNMDGTLSMIILPMLKMLKQSKHGSPFVDDEDVPKHLRSTAAPELTQEEKDNGHTDENFHKRWEWVLDEIIWTFEQLQPDVDWEQQFYTGEADYLWEKTDKAYDSESPGSNLYEMKEGPNHTLKFDREGYTAHAARIKHGLMMFGKYYQSLWD